MKVKLSFLFAFIIAISAYAENFEVAMLRNSGPVDRCINLVILGDGYTVSEQEKFIRDAQTASNDFFNTVPYSSYKDYFNVAAIKVISSESGIKHPRNSSDNACSDQPAANPNNYFGTTFDGGVSGGHYHRLVVITDPNKLTSVLADKFPDYDIVLVLANSTYYGGSGGTYAVATTEVLSSEAVIHEIGHSFASLADEYWAGDFYYYDEHYPNATMVSNPQTVKWKNWIGHLDVGVYKMGDSGKSNSWYRPHEGCKMRYLGVPFCSVCTQAIIEKIHTSVNESGGVILGYSPTETNLENQSDLIFSLSKLLKPDPNTLKITWELNGNAIAHNVETITVHPGQINQNSVLSVLVTDTTHLLRVDNHASLPGHVQKITWNIKQTQTVQSWQIGTPTPASVTASLYDGTLTVSGTGAMQNFTHTSMPWYSMKSSITRVIINDAVTTTGNCAFEAHTNLSSVTLPSSITDIGQETFKDCSKLAEIHCNNSLPPSIGNASFSGVNQSACKLYVPSGAQCTYAAASDWQKFDIVGAQFAIIVSAGSGGSISPNNTQTVNCNGSQRFDFYPNSGYRIDQVSVDGITSVTAKADGYYTFSNVTENHSISVTFSQITDDTGMEEVATDRISLYPNPVRDKIFIKSVQSIKKVEILDLSGRNVGTWHTASLQNDGSVQIINISSLPTGFYLVKIQTDSRMVVKKIIKK